MDLRALTCSPFIYASEASSAHLPRHSRQHFGWKSSELHTSLAVGFRPLHAAHRSRQKGVSSCIRSAVGSSPIDENVWEGRPIRTLLIDNYDSYTYNLYQLLSVINGVPPKVIKNDELPWEDLHKLLYEEDAFDSIVISPGPGSPMCAKDIGICLQVLQVCVDIPVLGVCLGHQALGYVNGAKVVHAPEPVHGRLSEIKHLECPLFKNIPSGKGSGFQVVRYHSLMLDTESFPEDLIPTAWAIDSCKSVSFESPSLNKIEHSAASYDIGLGSQNGWACTPCSVQKTAAKRVVSDTVSRTYASFDPLFPAKEENVLNGINVNTPVHEKDAKVIMAVSHRMRPHYGVQFHPESVATTFGKRILENFRDMTMEFWQDKGHIRNVKEDAIPVKDHVSTGMVLKGLASSKSCGGDSNDGLLRLYWEKVDGIASEAGGSEGIFCGLFGEGTAKDTFWLDSSLQHGGARFSFLGGKGGTLWKRLTYSMSDKHGSGQGILKIENNKLVEEVQLEEGFLEFLSSELQSCVTSKEDSEGLPFDFWGGFVGYLGYELKAECGAHFNQHKSKLPDASYFFVDQFIVVDHSNDDVYVVALYKESINIRKEGSLEVGKRNQGDHAGNRYNGIRLASVCKPVDPIGNQTTGPHRLSAQLWVKKIKEKLHELVEGGIDMSVERRYSSQLASSSLSSINSGSHFVISKSRKQYIEDVKSCLGYIRDGESYELCLTTQLQKKVNSLDALGLYLTLRKMNPAPYAAWLNFGPEDVCICCSSPERFLRLDQTGMLEAKPIKGTIPRGRSPAEDEALRIKLQDSEKDQAENLMIVDLLRNDLGRVCKPGSVHVPSLMAVESYATVHTMVSTVRGIKRPDITPIDCVRAAFPGGSMTGAPKLRSMELLDSLECCPRGVYSGTIGFFSVNSSFDLNIVIRTLVIHEGIASIGAGGAIVSLSDPGDEYEEMLLKTKAPIRAVSQLEALADFLSQEIENGSSSPALLGLH